MVSVFEKEQKLAGFAWKRRMLCVAGIVTAGP